MAEKLAAAVREAISRISSEPPPLVRKGVEQGGVFATENMLSPEIAKIPQKIFAPSARFYYCFLLCLDLFFVFLTLETIVLALVFQNFRACGAFFFPNIYFYKRFVHV